MTKHLPEELKIYSGNLDDFSLSQEEEEEDMGEDVENEPIIFSNDEDWGSDDGFIASEGTPSKYSDSEVEWISEHEEDFESHPTVVVPRNRKRVILDDDECAAEVIPPRNRRRRLIPGWLYDLPDPSTSELYIIR